MGISSISYHHPLYCCDWITLLLELLPYIENKTCWFLKLCCAFLMCILDIWYHGLRTFSQECLNSASGNSCLFAVFAWNWCVCPQIQSISQEPGSPSVSLVYVVKNQDAVLNGTISSGLLNQLTAELVGYFLFYPPLVIAERKYRFKFLVLWFLGYILRCIGYVG